MKRHFRELDEALIEAVPSVTGISSALNSINALEFDVESKAAGLKRRGYAKYVEPEVKQKHLRVFARHLYYPQSDEDKAHYKIWIEGSIINKKYEHLRFGSFFEQVKINLTSQSDKKNLAPVNQVCEWKDDELAGGSDAECFLFKLYSDAPKPFIAKITLVRNHDHLKRYEVQDKLKEIFPLLRADPSEEELLLAAWMYCTDRSLFNEKDKKYIKCDEKLKELLGVETLLASSLKGRLMKLVSPHKGISFEHFLSHTNTVEAMASAYRQSNPGASDPLPAAAFGVVGANMRQFDLEVDALNEHSYRYLAELNALARKEYLLTDELAKYYDEQVYLANAILEMQRRIDANTTFLRGAQRAAEEREAALEASRAMDEVMDVVVDSTVCEAKAAAAREEDRENAASLATEDPIHIYRLIANRAVPTHRRIIAANKAASAAAAAEKDGDEGGAAGGGGAETDLAHSASVDNLSALQTNGQAADKSTATGAAPAVPAHLQHRTALHTHSGFVDVGDENGFFSPQNKAYLVHLAGDVLAKKSAAAAAAATAASSTDAEQGGRADSMTVEESLTMDEL